MAVTVALMLSLLLAVMAFVIDTGYLYSKKNRHQNAVEAAALSAVLRLCEGDWDEVARSVVSENGLDSDPQSLTIESGFYDAREEFMDDLGDYKDFGPPPVGRYVNAVRVRLNQTVKSLSAMNPDASIAADAVAYLQRIDMASLDPEGVIRLGHNSLWDGVVFFSNGQIQHPVAAIANRPPAFTGAALMTVGDVLSCPVDIGSWGFTGFKRMTIEWNSGSRRSAANIRPGMDPLSEIRPVDDETLDYMRRQADKVYTPDDAGRDNVYYGQGTGSDGGHYYYLDLAAGVGSERRTIFFDAADGTKGSVLIGPFPGVDSVSHTPNGYTVAGLTFVATCSIRIINYGGTVYSVDYPVLHVGGEGDKQAIIISAENIEVYPGSGSRIIFDGTVFRTGGDFIKDERSSSNSRHRIRVIADGNIRGKPYSSYANDPGLNDFRNDSRFGPPCPPGLARLGRLEAAQK